MEEHVNDAMGHDPESVEDTGVGDKKIRLRIALVGFVLFIVFVIGILFFLTNPGLGVGLSLSFIAGLTMIFLPCTLPMAFVIVPMTLGKAPMKGFLMAIFFGAGLSITLSFYGVFIASIGQFLGLTAATQLMLIVGGGASLLFGLSEIRLLKFRLPSYSGKFPDFIQKQGDYIKVFLLGLFLGNAGVGCPNPAFYVLMGYIAQVGDLFNGWILGLVHGIGRAVPLIFLAILGILGVNATSKLTGKQESIEKYMGWFLVYIGAFILTFGIFGHDWFVSSGFHTTWEKIVVAVAGAQFGENVLQHTHKLIDIEGFIDYGNMFFLALVGIITSLFIKTKKPSKKFTGWLIVVYVVTVLAIGFMTAWTFKLSPDAANESSHNTASQEEEIPAHNDPEDASEGHRHDENGNAIEEVATLDEIELSLGEVLEEIDGLPEDFTLESVEVAAEEFYNKQLASAELLKFSKNSIGAVDATNEQNNLTASANDSIKKKIVRNNLASAGQDDGTSDTSDESTTVDDGHTDHTHESVVRGPWYQDTTWWTYFLISIALILFLSYFVKKYLKVED